MAKTNFLIEINVAAIKIMAAIVESLPYNEIIECYLHPADNQGKIETILLANLF